jgi:hypothetical protein
MADLLNTLKEMEQESVHKQIEQVNEFLRVQMLKTFEQMIPTLRKVEDEILAGLKVSDYERESLRPMFRATIEKTAKDKIVKEVQEMIDKALKK